MHHPVMTEKHLADRWQVSLKTLRRWRLDGEGPVWHKLFRQVRYHDADILEFEQRSAQHLITLLGITREFKPAAEPRVGPRGRRVVCCSGSVIAGLQVNEVAAKPNAKPASWAGSGVIRKMGFRFQ